MAESKSVSREMAASPDAVWQLVSDLPRMGEWSGENTGGKWVGGATGPAVGAAFRGTNQNGWRRWQTSVKVVEAEPGERFSFRSSLLGLPLARWSYDIEPTATGCSVTETWDDERPGWLVPITSLASGVSSRDEKVVDNMAATLDRIAAAAES